MARLGVNVDHVATLRQARGTSFPDPVAAARLALEENVSCITVHLREDRRHIQDDDVRRIRALDGCRLNLEMAAEKEIINIALDIGPDQVTLVPERREELTTEGGLDVAANAPFYEEIARRFIDKGITVSLFIDPDPAQIEASAAAQAAAVEINTGQYSEAGSENEAVKELYRVKESVKRGLDLSLTVHAGHGLNYHNTLPVAEIPGIDELNIGHAIVSRAVFVGFSQAVRLMNEILAKGAEKARREAAV
jgi:pyridoxine 5-phosphate synthase